MRRWYKYILSQSDAPVLHEQDNTYQDHAAAMGGYEADENYSSKRAFFDRYFMGRYRFWDNFLRKHLKKSERVLFIGSGRCINELKLLEDGYNIVCSDLDIPPCFSQMKELFGDVRFQKINILDFKQDFQFDVVVSLSFIYLLSAEALEKFLVNTAQLLKKEGTLILDSAGSEDNELSNFIHDFFLKWEARVIVLISRFFPLIGKKSYRVVKKEFGYRRSNEEIVAAAKRHGFKPTDFAEYDTLTEFRRSLALSKLLINRFRFWERIFSQLGVGIPYIRMFVFSKI